MPITTTVIRPLITIVGHLIAPSPDAVLSRKVTKQIDNTIFVKQQPLVILSTDILDEDKLLTFADDKPVRIIMDPRTSVTEYNYHEIRGSEMGTTFVGKPTAINIAGGGTVTGTYSEIYYTLNGKDPSRTKSYLYRYRSINRRYSDMSVRRFNPSTEPSGYYDKKWIRDNLETLGFELKKNNTGNENFTIKARTYYQGIKSPVTIVKIKIIKIDQTSNEVHNSSHIL